MTGRDPKPSKKTVKQDAARGGERATAEELNIMLQEQLAQKTAALEATMRELDAFAYSVSHDLRAPLRHIAGFTDLLRTHLANSTDPLTQRYIATITSSAVRMGEMIEKLLALSRIGREPLRTAPLSLRQVLDEVIGELQPMTAGRQIEWRIGELPAVTADRGQLSIALQNLLSNAVKSGAGRTPLIVSICGVREGGEHRISIQDNGVGFDMRFAENLFQVFQKLHPPAEFEGIGVGLVSVKRIIEKHGGRVWAQAEPQVGATFHFTLPVS